MKETVTCSICSKVMSLDKKRGTPLCSTRCRDRWLYTIYKPNSPERKALEEKYKKE